MKRLVALFLAMMLVLGLVACGNEKETTPAADAPTGGNQPATTAQGNVDPQPTQGSEAPQPTEPEPVDPNAARYGGTLNVCWSGNGGDNFDPLGGSGWVKYIWMTNVFENFLTRDNEGHYRPGVCDFELSDDQLTLKLWPREGVKFHDGSPVTVDDLEASIYYNHNSQMADGVVKHIVSFEKDEAKQTITIQFDAYDATTMTSLSTEASYISVLPARVLEKYKIKGSDSTVDEPIIPLEDAIGTGPYKIDVQNTVSGYMVALVRFDDYVQKTGDYSGFAGPRYAYMDKINVYFNSEENAITMGLMAGTYDIASVKTAFGETLRAAGLVETPDPINNIAYIAFNTSDHRPAKNADLRKAIAAALDYETILKVTYGEGYYNLDPCPMDVGPYYTTVFAEQDYFGKTNLDLAKSYLQKAGYNGEEIILAADSSSPNAVAIESMLKEAGINVRVDYMDNSAYKSLYGKPTEGEFDMAYLSSAHATGVPSSLVTNLRVRFWRSNWDQANEWFNTVSGMIYGSEESVALWKTMSTAWAEDAHIITLGSALTVYTHNADLNPNFQGSWRCLYNAYWNNPADHVK
jgi:peptide/nickel transport system substrate-binding protein